MTRWRSEAAFKKMIEVLSNELPTNISLPQVGCNPTDFAYAYGMEVGYRRCLANIEAMSQQAPSMNPLESTFGEPQQQS